MKLRDFIGVILLVCVWTSRSIDALYSKPCNTANHNELGVNGGIIPDESITASSFSDDTHKPARARLDQDASGQQATSWCAKDNNKEQWLQVDLVAVRKVTHLATQGQFDPLQVGGNNYDTSWVTEYMLEYKNEKDASYSKYSYANEHPLVFAGNTNGNETTCHELPYPLNVQYIRLRPVAWKNKICMRVGLFGEKNATAIYSGPVMPTAPVLNDTWWWTFFWILVSALLLAMLVFMFLYFCYIRKRKVVRHKSTVRKSKSKPVASTRRIKEAYANEAYNMTIITHSHTTTVTMPEQAEEAEEDEVQEVTAEFSAEEVLNKRGIIGFSVTDEDDEVPKNDDIEIPHGENMIRRGSQASSESSNYHDVNKK
ncbi:uncharacterized protein LOC5507590 [Nematostella vectensis]|uniref:uncharacterized protein LOC5507590 n=1 Tax=Nematostella vectensis TaxID=45351 RepID=UPI0013904C2E|nr:uncharacterized protein LOC5507590 [Nematostella vectensis]